MRDLEQESNSMDEDLASKEPVTPTSSRTESCTCLSISRDPLCVFHGDVDKVQAVYPGATTGEVSAATPNGSFGYCAICYQPLDQCSHCDGLLQLQREAWEAGFRLCRSYGDNHAHFDGEQKERQWDAFLAAQEREGLAHGDEVDISDARSSR
jgi:hypothetical protein